MSKSATNSVIETDFLKLMDPSIIMSGFKMTGIDMSALMDVQRKNIEMMTAINQAVVENMQSFAQRQAELMRQGFEETTNLMNTVMSSPMAQDKVACQAEASKSVVEKCMANARDTAETFAKYNSQAMKAISNRMRDGVQELQGLIKTNIAA